LGQKADGQDVEGRLHQASRLWSATR
jgi:hypothetical protein